MGWVAGWPPAGLGVSDRPDQVTVGFEQADLEIGGAAYGVNLEEAAEIFICQVSLGRLSGFGFGAEVAAEAIGEGGHVWGCSGESRRISLAGPLTVTLSAALLADPGDQFTSCNTTGYVAFNGTKTVVSPLSAIRHCRR